MTETPQTDVSILLVTRNRVTFLPETIASILASMDASALSAELILADNGSSDETPELLDEVGQSDGRVRVLTVSDRGKSKALNVALDHVRGKVILFTDDDVRVAENWIEVMAGPILADRSDFVGGSITMAEHLRRPWMTEYHEHFYACFRLADTEGGALIGANMAGRRSCVERIRFDENLGPGALGFADDLFLQVRAVDLGFRIVNVAASVEHHFDPARLDRDSLIDHLMRNGASEAYVYRHWLHSKQRFARARLLEARARLGYWRRRNRALLGEPPTHTEMELIWRVGFKRQYLRERRVPAHYPLSSTPSTATRRGIR